MKKITPLFTLVLIIGFAIGCADDLHGDIVNLTLDNEEVVVNSPNMLAGFDSNRSNAQEKNHRISFNGKFKVWSVPPSPGNQIQVNITGSGTATRMGKAKLEIQETITIPDTDLWEADACVVITAANGDELHFNYSGTVDTSGTPVMTFTATCEVKGGTGAYKNAKGTLKYTGSRSWDSGSGTAAFTGEISY
jgi:hypothetical protein